MDDLDNIQYRLKDLKPPKKGTEVREAPKFQFSPNKKTAQDFLTEWGRRKKAIQEQRDDVEKDEKSNKKSQMITKISKLEKVKRIKKI